MEGWMKVL